LQDETISPESVNMLGGFYSQQQFLRNLDVKANLAPVDQPSVMDESYKEFVMQLASWDTRRDFWSQTDYYKQRMVGNSKADAALLDEMINNIQFSPHFSSVRSTCFGVKIPRRSAL
jgi:lipopolysaccharide biosynthesis protein WzzE